MSGGRRDSGARSDRRGGRRDRRQKRSRRPLVVAVVAVLLVVGALGAWTVVNDGYLFGIRTPLAAPDYEGTGGEAVVVEVPQGNGYTIGAELAEQDVVASAEAFVRAFNANPDAASIQPGTREMKLRMSAESAVALLAQNNVDRAGLTVVEGSTVAQIQQTMIETGWPEQDVKAAIADPGALGLPAEAGGKLEGWLAASTYEARPDSTSAADVLKQMVALTVEELNELQVPKERWREVIITASIVEREAPDDYRGEVARVIQNRLDTSEVLGMDAIESYYWGKPAHELTREQLSNTTDVPFNSRRMDGLPPTAIGAPSRASVQAVMDPPAGDWIYYVTVNLETQETKFTASADEFQIFKTEYQTWAAENGY